MKKKKRGPKPRYGRGDPCTRRSISMPKALYEFCTFAAMIEGTSFSKFVCKLIEREIKK